MHPNSIHTTAYNFKALTKGHPKLSEFIFKNKFGTTTIDFFNEKAVFHLNKALLKCYYNVQEWNIPDHYLCPPIPGRADYIHFLADLLSESQIKQPIKGLDIGVGANCIYPILASQIYHWKMVGVDINKTAIVYAKQNASFFSENIEIRHQKNNAAIFEGIIKKDEYFQFTMCNPPFHSSEEEANKRSLRKLKNLQKNKTNNTMHTSLNFGGQANELWCNGGEALFIKRMITQSVAYKNQVLWFTSLVSRKENLPKIYKQLKKQKAIYKTISMEQGNKKSRFIAWKF